MTLQASPHHPTTQPPHHLLLLLLQLCRQISLPSCPTLHVWHSLLQQLLPVAVLPAALLLLLACLLGASDAH
jgi:hypothetical protein